MDDVKNTTKQMMAISKEETLQTILKSGRDAGISVRDPKETTLTGIKEPLSKYVSYFLITNS